jgi:hypothetical protein
MPYCTHTEVMTPDPPAAIVTVHKIPSFALNWDQAPALLRILISTSIALIPTTKEPQSGVGLGRWCTGIHRSRLEPQAGPGV